MTVDCVVGVDIAGFEGTMNHWDIVRYMQN